MNYDEALLKIEQTLDELKEKNKTMPIIVEGEKDIAALRSLGMKGIIIQLNQGISLPDFCDRISRKYKEVIILTDWDRKGGRLCFKLKKNLAGRAKCHTTLRKILARYATTNDIEGLPSWIQTLKERLNGVTQAKS